MPIIFCNTCGYELIYDTCENCMDIPAPNESLMLTTKQITIIEEEVAKLKDDYPGHINVIVMNTLTNIINHYGTKLQIDELIKYLEDVANCSWSLKENIQERIGHE